MAKEANPEGSGFRSRTTIGIIVLLGFFTPTLSAQSTAAVDSFYAPSLGAIKRFAFILPSPYNRSTKYPILYLLHGYGGDYSDWSKRTSIAEYIRKSPLIVIMPDGENSWYVNSISDPRRRFEDYMINDLPAYVEAHFAVDTSRSAIAGLSMGGNGSLVLAMRHPTLFRFVGSLSGAITVPHSNNDTSSLAVKYLRPSLIKAYGENPGLFRNEHDVFFLCGKLAQKSSPYFYLVIGEQDDYRDFVPAHHQLIDTLRTYNLPYEYHEAPGKHNWLFWDREVQPMLKRMMVILGEGKGTGKGKDGN